ncbi:MAG TPA: DUF2080 family transposase-associated protein [Candidatus Pacearchaeota archaeon]|nr:DUF2080 family transposase-associated protein [Candidatus Pacearchaeota archaeon]HDZ60218.1 DUF2080 family transposase-associated protein [Candidatus Pacearchaeota archaeon]HDZ61086.1 DUF2080 family transposase-associated protein [Candidatus Pacearchaeota archaeon]HDZ61210.1 DUF2080 family transposase-associated protein [Candidatus Pacearchaeota archaeon]HDZ61431.1 DUF2080 family transposase-associated protein [Candidatus Pacearchaeota archaeon]
MRKIEVLNKKIKLSDNVEVFYEKIITQFGNSAKVDAPKKFIGKRAYVIILKK